MKNACFTGSLLITGCAQQTFTVQNKPAAVAPKETITHHFFVSGIGQKKTVDAAKFVAAQKVLLLGLSKHVHEMRLLVIAQALYSRWKRVCIAHNCMSCLDMRRSITAH